MHPLLALFLCPFLHIATIALLSVRRGQQSSNPASPNQQSHSTRIPFVPAWTIKALGLSTALLTLHLPYRFTSFHSLIQCVLRVASFFYACKLLDLAICRSDDPPVLERRDESHKNIATTPVTVHDHATYTIAVLTSMRYLRFNTRVLQPQRPQPPKKAKLTALLPPPITLVCCVLGLFLLVPELACLTFLVLISLGFETLHTLVHPSCEHPVFYDPLLAPSMSAFWTTHWHVCAGPFLYSLAYRPMKKMVAHRAGGVLAAFALSGVWHGWAAAALVDRGEGEGEWIVGLMVWGLFVMFGVVCLVDDVVWGEKEGGWWQRGLAWGSALGGGGLCLRVLGRWTSLPLPV